MVGRVPKIGRCCELSLSLVELAWPNRLRDMKQVSAQRVVDPQYPREHKETVGAGEVHLWVLKRPQYLASVEGLDPKVHQVSQALVRAVLSPAWEYFHPSLLPCPTALRQALSERGRWHAYLQMLRSSLLTAGFQMQSGLNALAARRLLEVLCQ